MGAKRNSGRRIAVRYFGILREAAGKAVERISIEGTATGMDLIDKICSLNGSRFRRLVLDSEGNLREGLALAVNGDTISYVKLQRTKCNKISEFVILPPISGG